MSERHKKAVTDGQCAAHPAETGRAYRAPVPSETSNGLGHRSTTHLSVVFVRWPSERHDRTRLAEAGVPRLLLVEPGAPPPETWEIDEDWIRIPADPIDLHQRAEMLRRRCAPEPVIHIDEHGLLRRDERWTALSTVELALVGALLERVGHLVRRDELERAAWPGDAPDARVLDRAISRCRTKLAPLEVRIHRIPGAGYLLEAARTGTDRR